MKTAICNENAELIWYAVKRIKNITGRSFIVIADIGKFGRKE